MVEKVQKNENVQVEETVEYFVADENDEINERTKKVTVRVGNEQQKKEVQDIMNELDKKGLTKQKLHQPERVVDKLTIQEWLNQHLPAEANATLGMAINMVSDIRGEAAFINENGIRTFHYEFSCSIELVQGGEGKWIQIANLKSDGTHDGLQQNEAQLSGESAQKLIDSIHKVLKQLNAESLESKWGD